MGLRSDLCDSRGIGRHAVIEIVSEHGLDQTRIRQLAIAKRCADHRQMTGWAKAGTERDVKRLLAYRKQNVVGFTAWVVDRDVIEELIIAREILARCPPADLTN